MSDLFAQTAQTLISGGFICKTTMEEAFDHLSVPSYRDDLESYLNRILLTIAETSDGEAFFAASMTPEEPAVAASMRRMLSTTINDLEPLVGFLAASKNLLRNDRPLQPGDLLRETEMLQVAEDAPAIAEVVQRLCDGGLFKTNQRTLRGRLSIILTKLEGEGFLIQQREGRYQATGKWAMLYDVMAFVADHEELDVSEDSAEQGTLAL